MDEYAVCRLIRYLPILRSLPPEEKSAISNLRARLREALADEDVRLRALALWEELSEDLACLSRMEQEEVGTDWARELLALVEQVSSAALWLREEPRARKLAARVAAGCDRASQGMPLGAAIVGPWTSLRALLQEAEAAMQMQRASSG